MANRVYWVGLLGLVRKVCSYWTRYGARMPADLPTAVKTAMTGLTIACDALQLYDLSKAHGKPDDTGIGGF